jgi:hypothetical protein
VNLSDFTLLRQSFGMAGGWAGGDFNGDGSVNLSDFTILRQNFGFDRGTGAAAGSMLFPAHLIATVPEPTLGLSLGVVSLLALRRRHRSVSTDFARIPRVPLNACSASSAG